MIAAPLVAARRVSSGLLYADYRATRGSLRRAGPAGARGPGRGGRRAPPPTCGSSSRWPRIAAACRTTTACAPEMVGESPAMSRAARAPGEGGADGHHRPASSARAAPARSSRRAPSTGAAAAPRAPWSSSTAGPSRSRSWRASSSATRRAPSPARSRASRGSSSSATRARCSSTRSASCRRPLQTKLLRFLQEREIERVGGTAPIKVDVRLIAATNRDLAREVKAGTFRQDLYYRLNVVSLDAAAAARAPRRRAAARQLLPRAPRAAREPARSTGSRRRRWDCILRHDWPGNVRELENAIERAVVLGTDEWVRPEDLPEALHRERGRQPESRRERGRLPRPGERGQAEARCRRRSNAARRRRDRGRQASRPPSELPASAHEESGHAIVDRA